MKKLIILLTVLTFQMVGKAQVLYGPYEGDFSEVYGFGWGKMETYDVAMHVDYASLRGKKIIGMRFPLQGATKGASDFKVWLTHELTVASSAVQPDITSADAFIRNIGGYTWVEGYLAEPYDIDGPVYAGFSINMETVDGLADMYPVLVIERPSAEGCWIHTTRSYRKFQDFGASEGVSSTLQLILDDATVPAHAAVLSPVDNDVYLGTESPNPISFNLANTGKDDIRSIDVTVAAIDPATDETITTTVKHYDLPTPLRGSHIGRTALISFTLGSAAREGDFPMTTTVTAINGESNLDPINHTDATLHIIPFAPHRRPLVEEYTGTWCGYCPRGYVGMEHMKEIYGDEFVGVAYHYNDKMEITQYYPSQVDNYPLAWIDRVIMADAYFGDTTVPFGIQDTWLRRSTVATEANLDVEGGYSSNKQYFEITSKVRFVRDVANANSKYCVVYIMTADGFKDVQKNNFDPSHAGSLNDDMAQFLTGEQYVPLEFCDVVVATSDQKGVTASIPTRVKAGEVYRYTHRFKVADIKSSSGAALMTNGITPNAVCLLLNVETGEVVNAAKMSYERIVGLDTVLAEPSSTSRTGYYDLMGRQLINSSSRTGVSIENGKKVIRR